MATTNEAKAAIDAAWTEYREASRALPLTLPFSGYKRNGVHIEGFLERDEALWRRYLAAEREILRGAQKAA